MQNPDRALTKREIYKHIWQHENYDDNNLSVFISRLRKVLESSSGSQYYLYTVRGVGYRFSGDRR
ncbi:winged helix-turn-helix domain-containing protein [Paenibacillus sp. KN14-4R]|uniref:winged helix-turn-helix domain-containing protein n=1 Tax=Paenibacillus sp. KN14-4R TaxID=3445773 RepID=UPI003F9FF8EB